VKAWYRYYQDDWGIRAHSLELAAYQYVLPWLYVRGSYRYHHQSAADFFTTSLAPPVAREALRTADSDLADFHANEWSVSLTTVRSRAHPWSIAAELLRYTRSNDLTITATSLTLGRLL
jgi:hypothetical protein